MKKRGFIIALAAAVIAIGGCQAGTEKAVASAATDLDTPPLTLETQTGGSEGARATLEEDKSPSTFEAPHTQAATPAVESRPAGPRPLVFADAAPEDGAPRITIDRLETLLARNEAVVVDVRSVSAYGLEHARGAINIPEEDLPQRLAELPHDRMIVTYCT